MMLLPVTHAIREKLTLTGALINVKVFFFFFRYDIAGLRDCSIRPQMIYADETRVTQVSSKANVTSELS